MSDNRNVIIERKAAANKINAELLFSFSQSTGGTFFAPIWNSTAM